MKTLTPDEVRVVIAALYEALTERGENEKYLEDDCGGDPALVARERALTREMRTLLKRLEEK